MGGWEDGGGRGRGRDDSSLTLSLSLFLSLAHSFSLFLALTRSLGPRIVMGKGPIGSGPMRVGRGGASSSLSLFFLVKSPGGPLNPR